MTSTVSPVGSDPSSSGATPQHAPSVDLPRRGRIRRIAEEEHILVILLAGFGLIFLFVFPPALIVNDSWLNLMAGREVVENGLPSVETLTIYGLGSTWTDQQWGAQSLMYGVYSLGGFALLSILACVSVVGAFSLAAAASRSLGAGPRAFWATFLPVLVAAPWAWSIRAQMLTLPLYTALVWLLASQARAPSRRVWLALPIVVVWANLHGSVALGALLVVLLGTYELIRTRGASWRRSVPLIVLAPLAVLATPYGPATTARYYYLMLVDPPFAGHVTEWDWAAPGSLTVFFYVLAALALATCWLGRRRLTMFDIALLLMTFAGGVSAIRGVVWFALACMIFVPVAIGRKLETKRPGEPRRTLNLAITTGLTVALIAVAASLFGRSESWFEGYWPREPVEAVRNAIRPGDRAFISDRFSDWMLFKIPALRGRVAYDVRFELYDRAFFDRLQKYAGENTPNWKSFADGYRIVVVDEQRRSHTEDFAREPGARILYKSDELTVIARR